MCDRHPPHVSTVLEQDHFFSDFLCSHVTNPTNSHNRDDELPSRILLEDGPVLVTCRKDNFSGWRDKLSGFVEGLSRLCRRVSQEPQR
jgi:hypothetical protein